MVKGWTSLAAKTVQKKPPTKADQFWGRYDRTGNAGPPWSTEKAPAFKAPCVFPAGKGEGQARPRGKKRRIKGRRENRIKKT